MEWWQAEGWASPPRRETARGPVTVYRAAGGGSNALGNCFFIPTRSLTGAVQGLTAQALEADLNAALWGNLFREIFVYSILPGTVYYIGPAAQSGPIGRPDQNGQVSNWSTSIRSPGLLEQVSLESKSPTVARRLARTEELSGMVTQKGRFRPRVDSHIFAAGPVDSKGSPIAH